MTIRQGDIFWAPLDEADGHGTGITHPHVVIQDDAINQSRVRTVVVCGLTTNRKRAAEPGNVQLDPGEGNLPKPSIVVVAQVSAVRKEDLGDYIGTLSRERVGQILDGMRSLQWFLAGR
ncbi:type II toxin-antitoxin system PemK/MazF family toxin [Tundrisphaera sp. TA3]|uniref:type II toxin-antitoxin system PemK/MazF family toxin n=1 Tax=Tundrisphaera sp. TA3 TaxID=3435775 RepID=UPI003EBBDCEE